MSDIPATMTFDNLAAVSLKELTAPVLLKLAELEKNLAKLEKDCDDLNQKVQDDLVSVFKKKYKFLLNTLSKIGEPQYDFEGVECDHFCFVVYPKPVKSAKVDNYLHYQFPITEKDKKPLASYKKYLLTCKERGDTHDKVIKLRRDLQRMDAAVNTVKDDLMGNFLASNPGHNDFKNFIKQKIAEAVK